MKPITIPVALVVTALSVGLGRAQPAQLPPGDKEPFLRLEAGGPTSYVTALAFRKDGQSLYAAGWDKVVRTWTLNDQGQFRLDPVATYRVPIGPGLDGAINAIALSDDGAWLAVGGRFVFRGSAGFRQVGRIVPTLGGLTPEMRLDMGTIYLFQTADPSRPARLLRGQMGPVQGLSFAPAAGKPPLLVSFGVEHNRAGADMGAARLWNAATGELLNSVDGIPVPTLQGEPLPDLRPGLTAWHTGAQLRQVRVAVAWYSGKMVVWDAAQKQDALRAVADANFNLTVAHNPQTAELLTASFGPQRAHLQRWQPIDQGDPKPLPGKRFPGKPDAFPYSLGLLASRADARLDLAAVVLTDGKTTGSKYTLQLLDIGAGNWDAVRGEVLLWTGSAKQTSLAVAPRGRYVAVAGNDTHDILLFPIADLLRGKNEPQRLRSAAAVFRSVAFARRGKDLGLLVNERTRRAIGAVPRPPQPEDLILDVGRRQLTTDRTGWETAAPARKGWRAAHDQDGSVITIFRDDQPAGRVKLPARHQLSDYALLPPQGPGKVPLLALATHQTGQPRLALYNAATGAQLRQYSGHSDRLYALAFSADGRLLASCAEDQTVCVWSLTDLDQVLGRLGRVTGVTVRTGDAGVVVTHVFADSPAQGKLREKDLIAGLADRGKLRPVKSGGEFYRAIEAIAPGGKVTLRVSGPDGKRDVELPVDQGIDERKPLLALLVTRPDAQGQRDWVGWNPLGPYESSTPQVERYVGWHFNRGQVEEPTSFARMDQYRAQFFRRGLVEGLLSRADVRGIPPQPPPPPPRLGLWIQQDGADPQPDVQGRLLVRRPQVALRVRLGARDPEGLQSLTWQLDDAAAAKLDLADRTEPEWSVPLKLARGEHRLRVIARTRDTPPQQVEQELTLRYQPPPPRIGFAGKDRELAVRDARFTFQATVSPEQAGESVRAVLRQLDRDLKPLKEVPLAPTDPAKPLDVKQTVQLRPGLNYLELVAINRDAGDDRQGWETERLILKVTYTEKAPPPTVALDSVVPLSPDKAPAAAVKADPLQPVQVHARRVRITGRIKGTEPLVRAAWTSGAGKPDQPLTGFEAGKAKEVTIAEEMTLQPGRQTLRFLARTGSSLMGEAVLTIDYQPPLPVARVLEPTTGLVLYEGETAPEVALKVQLRSPPDEHKFDAAVLVNGKPAGVPAIDPKTQVLTARVPLQIPESVIQVTLANSWGAAAQSEAITVRYLRPPRIVKLQESPGGEPPAVDLVAEVRSALPLLPETAELTVNGQPRQVRAVVADKAEAGVWKVQLRRVSLEAGSDQNEVRFAIANAEGVSREPGKATVRAPKVQPPPVVEILEPPNLSQVADSRQPVRFRVQSSSPLRQVQLVQAGKPAVPVDLSRLRPDAEGRYDLQTTLEVELATGENRLRVEAVNQGGQRASPTLLLSYVSVPARLRIDRLAARQGDGPAIVPTVQEGGRLEFPPVAQGQVRLHGHVVWDTPQTRRRHGRAEVVVHVNGFRQLAAFLQPVSGDDRKSVFEADLVLNRDRGNHVQVTLPSVNSEAGNRSSFLVDCAAPARRQRLHLLVVSMQPADERELKGRVYGAFRCQGRGGNEFYTPVFDPGFLYGPQIGHFAGDVFIYQRLAQIQGRIRDLSRAGVVGSDVVVIYFQGAEAFYADGHYLQSAADASTPNTQALGISCKKLVDLFAETPGAHLLLLDVARGASSPSGASPAGTDTVAGWTHHYSDAVQPMGVLRYAWLGSESVPYEMRLITALREALTQSHTLVEVDAQINRLTAALPQSPKVLSYDGYVAADLKTLLLGR